MISYEELDRALGRWKIRSQGGAPQEGVPEAEVSASAPLEVVAEEVPLPIGPGDLGSYPDSLPGAGDRTGEIDLAEVESYEDVQK
ncbi:MAG TPA: hypothetical protein VHH90_02725 [Polyangia bacterium]|nr:hypothetical protein [Polyangia bacterium]